jgi:hypothetical protein
MGQSGTVMHLGSCAHIREARWAGNVIALPRCALRRGCSTRAHTCTFQQWPCLQGTIEHHGAPLMAPLLPSRAAVQPAGSAEATGSLLAAALVTSLITARYCHHSQAAERAIDERAAAQMRQLKLRQLGLGPLGGSGPSGGAALERPALPHGPAPEDTEQVARQQQRDREHSRAYFFLLGAQFVGRQVALNLIFALRQPGRLVCCWRGGPGGAPLLLPGLSLAQHGPLPCCLTAAERQRGLRLLWLSGLAHL